MDNLKNILEASSAFENSRSTDQTISYAGLASHSSRAAVNVSSNCQDACSKASSVGSSQRGNAE